MELCWMQVAYLNNAGVSLMEKGSLALAKDLLHRTVFALRSVATHDSSMASQIHNLAHEASRLLAAVSTHKPGSAFHVFDNPFRVDANDFEDVVDCDTFISAACLYNLANCCLRLAGTGREEGRRKLRSSALHLLKLSSQCLADTPLHEIRSHRMLWLRMMQHKNILALLQGEEGTPDYLAASAIMSELNMAARSLLIINKLGFNCTAAAA